MADKKDFYEVLGVQKSASADELKKYKPDVLLSKEKEISQLPVIFSNLLKDDKEDTMWVGTENGLMKIDIKNDKMEAKYNKWQERFVNIKENDNYVLELHIDKSDSLEYGINTGDYIDLE